jgi:hypothetical protein
MMFGHRYQVVVQSFLSLTVNCVTSVLAIASDNYTACILATFVFILFYLTVFIRQLLS